LFIERNSATGFAKHDTGSERPKEINNFNVSRKRNINFTTTLNHHFLIGKL
jgi:hypothetical protein